ncbi:MAG TPA: hypothetical protein VI894_02770 [Candidatus Nanoarchaeia archaeon]|nr:hypothetical protein [Candidatus Nanoarchaeia archaeon]
MVFFPRKRGNKKAIGMQIDWIISFGIFLVYLGWLFIFVLPTIQPSRELPSLSSIINTNVKKSASWEIGRIPLFVYSSAENQNEPIILSAPSYNTTNFAFSDSRQFAVDENRIFFLADIKKGQNYYWIIHSSENYSLPRITSEFFINSTTLGIPTAGTKFVFENSSLKSAYYVGDAAKISNMDYFVNDVLIETTAFQYYNTSIMAEFSFQSQPLNHTSFMFAKNSRIYNYVSPYTYKNMSAQKLTVLYSLGKYAGYYANNLYKAQINYNFSACTNFTEQFIDFYSSNNGVAFIYSKMQDIRICNDNTTIFFSVATPLDENFSYKIYFHKGDYNNVLNLTNPYEVAVGADDTVNGLSLKLLREINATPYSDLKQKWNIPSTNDFSFSVVNETEESLFNYRPVAPPPEANVYATQMNCFILDKFGNQQACKIIMRGWI